MKICKRALCVLLSIFIFCGVLQTSAANDIMLTAVNDQFLALSAGTMPTRKNGEYYVPYTVFSGSLGVNAAYSDSQQLLILYNLDNTLNFAVGQGYVYDGDDNSYSQPAYSINGTIYVPVKLVCGLFGFSYSMLSGTYPVLRVVNDSASLSDHTFLENNTKTIARIVKAYQNGNSSTSENPAPPPPKEQPTIPVQPPKAEEQIPQPSVVYLTFTGAPDAKTDEILDILSSYMRTATFFLRADADLNDDSVRRLIAEGHSIGLSFTADVSVADPQELIRQLIAANDTLLYSCGVQTRLVMVENGADALSFTQMNALSEAGFFIWESTLDAQDRTRSAFRAAERVLKGFQQSNAPAVVHLHQGKNTLETLEYILRYMRETAIPHASIRLSTKPIRSASVGGS